VRIRSVYDPGPVLRPGIVNLVDDEPSPLRALATGATWLRLSSAVAAVCISGLAVGCGSGDSETEANGTELVKTQADPSEASTSPQDEEGQDHAKSEEPRNVVSGQFEATPGGGYTLEVAYQLEPLEAEVDIANAAPGEAIVHLSSGGELTFTNTTRARNLGFNSDELPMVNLYWPRSQLPSSERCSDGLLVRGVVHCGLTAFRGEFAPQVQEGNIELGPDGSTFVTLDPRLLISGTTVDEQQSEAVSKLIESTTPSLVTLLLDGLEPSCGIEEFGPLGLTAVLTGAGQVLADGGPGREGDEPPLCSQI
jgi:hypothetical protein